MTAASPTFLDKISNFTNLQFLESLNNKNLNDHVVELLKSYYLSGCTHHESLSLSIDKLSELLVDMTFDKNTVIKTAEQIKVLFQQILKTPQEETKKKLELIPPLRPSAPSPEGILLEHLQQTIHFVLTALQSNDKDKQLESVKLVEGLPKCIYREDLAQKLSTELRIKNPEASKAATQLLESSQLRQLLTAYHSEIPQTTLNVFQIHRSKKLLETHYGAMSVQAKKIASKELQQLLEEL